MSLHQQQRCSLLHPCMEPCPPHVVGAAHRPCLQQSIVSLSSPAPPAQKDSPQAVKSIPVASGYCASFTDAQQRSTVHDYCSVPESTPQLPSNLNLSGTAVSAPGLPTVIACPFHSTIATPRRCPEDHTAAGRWTRYWQSARLHHLAL